MPVNVAEIREYFGLKKGFLYTGRLKGTKHGIAAGNVKNGTNLQEALRYRNHSSAEHHIHRLREQVGEDTRQN